MPYRKQMSADTVAIISAIEKATDAAQIVADGVQRELVQHTQHDDERFETLTTLVESIATDVKSLLASRSFMRGAWKAITVSALVASALVTGVHAWWSTAIAFLRGH